jgi:hypothetical protein
MRTATIKRLLMLGVTLVFAAVLIGCSSLPAFESKPVPMKIYIGTNASTIKILGPLSAEERHQIGITLEMAASLVPSLKFDGWESVPMYWMDADIYDGICHYKDGHPWQIFITVRDRRSSYTNLQRFWLASIITHELSHFLHRTDDPFTATVTDHLLLKVLEQQPLRIIKWTPQSSSQSSSPLQ